jgi:hypothetical protein
MNQNVRPKFDRERLMFFRREHAGYASAMSPDDPNKALRVLNPTTLEIAELCDGELTIQAIKARYAEQYRQQLPSPLSRYVDQALYSLSLYDLITFEGGDDLPLSAGDPIPKVRRLEEWDLSAVRELYAGRSFPEQEDLPVFHFRHPYLTPMLYSDIMLRDRMFQQREFFYAIATGRRVDFVISFFDERPLKPLASLATVVGTPAYGLEEGLSCIFPVIIKEVRRVLHKLEWRYIVEERQYPEMTHLLEGFGFSKEATLIDEFGVGRHEIVFGMILSDGPPAATDAASDAADGASPDAGNPARGGENGG